MTHWRTERAERRREQRKPTYVELRAQGLGAREIAKTMGLTYFIVRRDLTELGLSGWGWTARPKPSQAMIDAAAKVHHERVAAKVAAGEKVCPRCTRALPFSAFARNQTSPDGRCGYCKRCAIAYVQDHRAIKGEPASVRRERLEPAYERWLERGLDANRIAELSGLRREQARKDIQRLGSRPRPPATVPRPDPARWDDITGWEQ